MVHIRLPLVFNGTGRRYLQAPRASFSLQHTSLEVIDLYSQLLLPETHSCCCQL